MISGIWLPIVTPFKDGLVDTEALQRLVTHYLDTDISGFIALGTTGEAALLSRGERLSVLHAMFEAVGTRLPIMVGIGGMDTQEMQREIQDLAIWDTAGYLVSAPAYIRPDQKGIEWHFGQIAGSTDRPIVLYDVPHRTGVAIEPETVKRILGYRNVKAIKACAPESFEALSELPLDLLCGTDDAFIDCLAAGGNGGILASAHLFPQLLCDVLRLFNTTRQTDAVSKFNAILPTLKLLFSAPNPSAIKAGLAIAGLMKKETRMPITEASSELTLDLELALSRIAYASYPNGAIDRRFQT